MMKKFLYIFCALSILFLAACQNEVTPGNETADSNVKIELYAQGKYNLTKKRRETLTNEQYEAYKTIVDGLDVASTEISVELPEDENSLERIKAALRSAYPLMALVRDMSYSADKKILNVSYLKSGNELKTAIAEFYSKVNMLLTTDILYAGDFTAALLLYSQIASSTPTDDVTLTAYDMIMTSKGSSVQFAEAYEYFLCLVGVECDHVLCDNWEAETIAVTQVKIGENYYYMSPYHEAAENGGKLLKYFGQNDDRAKILTGAEEFFTVDNDYNRAKAEECHDTTFSFTEFLEMWSFDKENNELKYTITDNDYIYKYN